MLPKRLRFQAVTKADRHETLNNLVKFVHQCSGWIVNHTMYSNKVICINFEMEARGIYPFVELLNKEQIFFTKETQEELTSIPNPLSQTLGNKEITCSLSLTFFNDEPDQRNVVPSIPG